MTPAETERIRDTEKYSHGDAAELEILERAGIRESGIVVITTHDDEFNVYITLYCRIGTVEAETRFLEIYGEK